MTLLISAGWVPPRRWFVAELPRPRHGRIGGADVPNEAPDVPDVDDEADGRDKRDPAQRLQGIDDRRPAPRGRELPELDGEALDAALRFVDRVPVLL